MFRRPPSLPEREDSAAVDTAWKIHAAIVDWTGKVDTKASFALALESASIAAIVSLTASGRRLSDLTSPWAHTAFWLGLACLMGAALTAASVVIPRLRSSGLKAESRDNFIYFGHLRHWKPQDLTRALKQADVLPVLSRQLINMSRVAWTKHRRVQVSLLLAVAGGAFEFLAVLLS